MATRETSAFSAEHIAKFHRMQALRPVVLHRMGDVLEVWRDCANKPCRRARSCQRSDATCLYAFMQALPEEEHRLFRYALENRRDGLDPDEAIERAQARVESEIARGLYQPAPG
ncbi:hypothetical protein [Bosea lathyri]|uniref:Uncharacterized protein n=1 Tax=Bosea lathyri TaxID=1036778 RepID=A0A1H6D3J8_9HYPH|nr:hypothetical protein [Bosea lathyri]SEG79880.1 hypothetical protein SAMN04488115_11533 [Bosea lathyri]